MHKSYALLILLLLSAPLSAQKLVPVQREVVRVTEFATDKVYNKKTGEKLSSKEVFALLYKTPNIPMERVINNKGEVEKFLVDPGAEPSPMMNNWTEKVKPGEDFPELEFSTVEGKSLKLKDLRGKLVILRIETDAYTPRFMKDQVQKIDAAIDASPRKEEVAAILLFMNSAEQVKAGFDYQNSNFRAVPNASNFAVKLNLRSYPKTLVIDKQGKLLEEFSGRQEINIEALLAQ